MTYARAAFWIKRSSIILILTGLIVAMVAHPATDILMVFIADILFWPFDGAQSFDAPESRLLAAISGGVMIGWGVAFWIIADEGFVQAPELSRRIILSSVWVWFVCDSTASLLAGAPLNAVCNLFYLAIFAVPLYKIGVKVGIADDRSDQNTA